MNLREKRKQLPSYFDREPSTKEKIRTGAIILFLLLVIISGATAIIYFTKPWEWFH